MKKYLIDGYNLLKSLSFNAPLNLDLEDQRNHLIRLVKSYSQFEECQVQVIFDNSLFPKTSILSNMGKVQIKFTKPSMEADEFIKQQIRKEKNPSQLIIVSSDRAIQFAAKDHGAKFISSEDYCRLMQKKTPSSLNKKSPESSPEKYNPNLGEKEIDYWKNLFEKGDEGTE